MEPGESEKAAGLAEDDHLPLNQRPGLGVAERLKDRYTYDMVGGWPELNT